MYQTYLELNVSLRSPLGQPGRLAGWAGREPDEEPGLPVELPCGPYSLSTSTASPVVLFPRVRLPGVNLQPSSTSFHLNEKANSVPRVMSPLFFRQCITGVFRWLMRPLHRMIISAKKRVLTLLNSSSRVEFLHKLRRLAARTDTKTLGDVSEDGGCESVVEHVVGRTYPLLIERSSCIKRTTGNSLTCHSL